MTRDGKCFSSEPYPRSAMSVSETKESTSHLMLSTFTSTSIQLSLLTVL
uniref:Uncharacterized protein n=1 Tax=Arundo donax TaxID=35708 RepID=A0A0A9HLB4_ARUDO